MKRKKEEFVVAMVARPLHPDRTSDQQELNEPARGGAPSIPLRFESL